MPDPTSRSSRLDQTLADLLAQAPEIEAAAVVSFDGLPMASALPVTMDEDRVAAMSAALLSLGERAAEGLGRGELSQVYIEGENGTVFLVSADNEAVLVAVAARGAKVGMMLYEVRRAAAGVAEVLRAEPLEDVYDVPPTVPVQSAGVYTHPDYAIAHAAPVAEAVPDFTPDPAYAEPAYAPDPTYAQPAYAPEPVAGDVTAVPSYAPVASAGVTDAATGTSWPSYLPNGSADTASWA